MKFLVIVFMLISISAFSQNRFEKEFQKADSAFTALMQNKSDSVLLEKSIKNIETLDRDSISMRASEIVLIYWKGYTDCIIRYNETKSFDFAELEKQTKLITDAIKKLNGFKKADAGWEN